MGICMGFCILAIFRVNLESTPTFDRENCSDQPGLQTIMLLHQIENKCCLWQKSLKGVVHTPL